MTIRLIILLLTFISYKTINDKIIMGKLVVTDNPKYYSIEHIFIIIKSGNKVIDTAITSDKGEFQFSIANDKSKDLDIFYSGVGLRTVYLRHIKSLEDDTTQLNINIPTEYKRNIFGKAYCPKCGKAGMTYKINYGDAPIYTMKINDKGDTTYSPFYKGRYQAGNCVSNIQSPRWYCDRDKIEF